MNEQLETFITVAKSKSFNKSANQLFISTPAVIKQINGLEDAIKVKLFNRNHNGVTLTKAGEAFYADAIKLIAAYNQSINHAQELSDSQQVLRIGAGPFATGVHNNLWSLIGQNLPNLDFQFIPCSCALGSFNEFLNGINKEFDLVSSVYDVNLLKKYQLNALELATTPVKISVPITNPLSQKEKLTLTDLKNQTVALTRKGEFECFDQVRQEIEKHSDINVVDISGIDISALNNCVKSNWLLVSTQDWQSVHPMLAMKDVNWDFEIPFGLVYGQQHNQAVDEVLNFLKTTGRVKL